MTKKIPVMCTCPNVLLQWFSVSLYCPLPSSYLCCVLPPCYLLQTPLSLIKSALVHVPVSSLPRRSHFVNIMVCMGCYVCVSYCRLCVGACVCASDKCSVKVCGRRLVNGTMTSGVTSLITSVTFSQMSFLCD